MKHLIKLYNTWERAKDLFVKPSLKVYFGKWRNDPNLPVWRRGPTIHLRRKGKVKSITLPIWLRFYIINSDVRYKWKFDDIRYEFPPQFTIVAFGLSLSLTLHSPTNTAYSCDDYYWESLLYYVHEDKNKPLKRIIELCGTWHVINKDNSGAYFFALRPEYVVHKRQEEYYAAISDIKAQREMVIL